MIVVNMLLMLTLKKFFFLIWNVEKFFFNDV